MRLSLVLGLVAPCCLAAACGSSGPDFGSLKGETANQVLALTTTAISVNGFSFHFVDQSHVGLEDDDPDRGRHSGRLRSDTVRIRIAARCRPHGVRSRLRPGISRCAPERPRPVEDGGRRATAGRLDLPPVDRRPLRLRGGGPRPEGRAQPLRAHGPLHARSAPPNSTGGPSSAYPGTRPHPGAGSSGHTATIYVPTQPPYTPVGATLTFGSGSGRRGRGRRLRSLGCQGKSPAPPSKTSVAFSSLAG